MTCKADGQIRRAFATFQGVVSAAGAQLDAAGQVLTREQEARANAELGWETACKTCDDIGVHIERIE